MAQRSEQVTIHEPPSVVWQVLADFGGIARWAPNVDHSCLTTVQPEGVGVERRVQVGRNALLERVIEWEPGGRLGYTIQGLPPVIKSVTNTWSIEPDGNSTAITLTTDVRAGSRPPQQLGARVVARVLAKASRQMLDGLKRHLEKVDR